MKKIFFSLIVLSVGCFNVTTGQGRAQAGDDWKLTDDDATGMLGRLNNCDILHPCRNNSVVIDSDNDVYKWIMAKYSGVGTVTLVDARYRNSDEDRYRRLRDITDMSKYSVKNYKTKLVKVQINSTGKLSATQTIYYDCFTICPPPNDLSCGGQQNK